MDDLEFLLRMDVTSDISDKDHLVFTARSRWCQMDPVDPTVYNVGFQLIKITPQDVGIFERIFEKYGSDNKKNKKNSDYLWK